MPLSNSQVIYLAFFPSGKGYVGKTKNFFQRKISHMSSARRGSDTPMSRAIRKYGTPEWWLLETELTNQGAEEQEKYWISELQTQSNGYNVTAGGDGGDTRSGIIVSIETRIKMSQAQRNRAPTSAATLTKMRANTSRRPIVVFSRASSTNFWYFRSIAEACRFLHVNLGRLAETLNKKRSHTKGYWAEYLP